MTRRQSAAALAVSFSLTLALGSGLDLAASPSTRGHILTWGANNRGQLGRGSLAYSNSPLSLPSPRAAVAVTAGGDHTLAVAADGTVWSWGGNDYGQLGYPPAPCRTSYGVYPCGVNPRRVPGISGVAFAAAASGYSLAVRGAGSVWGWGNDDYLQLGVPYEDDQGRDLGLDSCDADGHTSANGATSLVEYEVGPCSIHPRQVPIPVPVASVVAESTHAYAVARDGSVWGWGDDDAFNDMGLQGWNPTQTEEHTPTRVGGLVGVVALCDHGDAAVALLSDGTLRAWGSNTYGALGNGTNDAGKWDSSHPVPAPVRGLDRVVSIACSGEATLAVRADGTVWTWGFSLATILGLRLKAGENPYDGYDERDLPVRVPGLPPIAFVAASDGTYAAVTADGTPWTWGQDDDGQAGIGQSREVIARPRRMNGVGGIRAISFGDSHAIALQDTHYVP